MITGQHVFTSTSVVELLASHLHVPPPSPSERLGRPVPPDLEALILRGLAKAPADRPQSAAAFREALLRCDVQAWTPADARAWWAARADRVRRAHDRERDRASDLGYVPTVTLARDAAELQ
jgi:serine/threonine-protein kinase